MKFNNKLILMAASLACASCSSSLDSTKITGQIKGLVLSSYYSAYAGQPEASSELTIAKDKIIAALDKDVSVNKKYGVGLLAGVEIDKRYNGQAGSGLLMAIERQPEIADFMITHEEATITAILNASKDVYSEMIGLSVSSLYEAMAREPEIHEKIAGYSAYINEAIVKVEKEESAYTIGYGSVSFFGAAARQKSEIDNMWATFKQQIDSLLSK